jgi:hypothetical protein
MSQTPPSNMAKIPGVTVPIDYEMKEEEEDKEDKEEEKELEDDNTTFKME